MWLLPQFPHLYQEQPLRESHLHWVMGPVLMLASQVCWILAQLLSVCCCFSRSIDEPKDTEKRKENKTSLSSPPTSAGLSKSIESRSQTALLPAAAPSK